MLDLASHINWLWALAGLLGTGSVGFVALLFFAPPVAAAIEKLAADFLSTRVGLVLAVGAICLLAGGLYEGWNASEICARKIAARDVEWQGKVDTLNAQWRAAFDKAAAAYAAARAAMDAQIKAKLDASNAQREKELEASDRDWQAKFDAYAASLKSDPACRITDEDLRR